MCVFCSYQQAVDQTRYQLDWEWYAASLEGVAACHAVEHSASPQQLEEYLKEALTYYDKRQATTLSIECLLKLARLYVYDLHNRVEASNVLMRVYNEMESSFTVQTKVILLRSLSLVCECFLFLSNFECSVRHKLTPLCSFSS